MILHEQRKKGKNSEYAPYLQYLFSKFTSQDDADNNNHHQSYYGQPPSLWSVAGQELLHTIHGSIFFPDDLVSEESRFFRECFNNNPARPEEDDEMQEEAVLTLEQYNQQFQAQNRKQLDFAYRMVVERSRSYHEFLVPLLDMFNHYGSSRSGSSIYSKKKKKQRSDPNSKFNVDGNTVKVFFRQNDDEEEEAIDEEEALQEKDKKDVDGDIVDVDGTKHENEIQETQEPNKDEKKQVNDDDADEDNNEFVKVYTKRKIHAGEELYIDYTYCDDEKGRRFDDKYDTSTFLRDYGLIDDDFFGNQQQRWTIPVPGRRSMIEDNRVLGIINFFITKKKKEKPNDAHQDDDGEDKDETRFLEIKWEVPNQAPPHYPIVPHLRKELERLEELKEYVLTNENNEDLPENERRTSLKYYNSLTLALKMVITDVEYAIEHTPYEGEPDGDKYMACNDFEDLYNDENGWYLFDDIRTFHQPVDFHHNKKLDDCCLLLNEYLHACVSNRPHYHEVFVHYPAHFLDKVQRVLFIGGGDSMVLHELLKYDDIELMVGLELDQQVVRSTFLNMGMQPHFDKHEKVEWWFGDAAQAMNVLPTEYYGSFDLVIVDILSEIAEVLTVNDETSIMEAAIMLMKPDGGIIIKNEDEGYVPGSTDLSKFTKFTVDVMYYDVPLYCLQTFVIGSNTVDFFAKEPTDHNVPTLYLKSVDEFQAQFDTWYTSEIATESSIVDDDNEEHVCHVNQEEEDNTSAVSTEDANPISSATTPLLSASTTTKPVGLIMIIDAEQISTKLDPSKDIQDIITNCLTTMEGIEFTLINTYKQQLQDGNDYILTFILEEGCVNARCFPQDQYCAIDVQLWKNLNKANVVKKELISAIGCELSSIYRIVSSGIVGIEENGGSQTVGPPLLRNTTNSNSTNSSSKSAKSCTANTQQKLKSNSFETETTFVKRENETNDFFNATFHSYNSSAAYEQFLTQNPIAEQNFIRYDMASDEFGYAINGRYSMTEFLIEIVSNVLDELSEFWSNKDTDQIQMNEINIDDQGLVLVASWLEGNFVIVWDGENRVDVNLFALYNSHPMTLVILTKSFGKSGVFRKRPATGDDCPRGTGRTITFPDETESHDEFGKDVKHTPIWVN